MLHLFFVSQRTQSVSDSSGVVYLLMTSAGGHKLNWKHVKMSIVSKKQKKAAGSWTGQSMISLYDQWFVMVVFQLVKRQVNATRFESECKQLKDSLKVRL